MEKKHYNNLNIDFNSKYYFVAKGRGAVRKENTMGISLEEFFDKLKKADLYGEFLVKLAYKYGFEKDYRISIECLSFGTDCTCWLNDWNEGEDDVRVLGFVETSSENIEKCLYIF